MLDKPDAAQTLAEVGALLETGAAGAFEQKVAANAVAIAAREIECEEDYARAEHVRLRKLLGRDGSLTELNRALCDAIRSGELDRNSPALVGHLRATAREKLKVDQPSYPAFRVAEDERG